MMPAPALHMITRAHKADDAANSESSGFHHCVQTSLSDVSLLSHVAEEQQKQEISATAVVHLAKRATQLGTQRSCAMTGH